MNEQSDNPGYEIIRQAKEFAKRPEEEQRAWLARLREFLIDFPDREIVLDSVRRLMFHAKAAGDARLKMLHAEETLEAELVKRIDGIADGSLELPQDELEALRVVAQITLLGHLTPSVRERLAQPDAQKILHDWLSKYACAR